MGEEMNVHDIVWSSKHQPQFKMLDRDDIRGRFTDRLPIDFLTISCEMPWVAARCFMRKTEAETMANLDKFKELIDSGNIEDAFGDCFTPDCGEATAAWYEWLPIADLDAMRRRKATWYDRTGCTHGDFHGWTTDIWPGKEVLPGLGPVLKAWREHYGLTRAEAARRLGYAASRLWDHENGKRGINVNSVQKYADVYTDGDIDLLLEGPDGY